MVERDGTTDIDSGPFLAAVSALSDALRSVDVPHMMIGAVAAAALGHSRSTTDVDATLWAPRLEIDHVMEALADHGVRPRVPNFEQILRQTRTALLQHEEGIECDIAMAFFPFEREALARAQDTEFLGLTVRIPTAEDLVVQKAAAFRPRDQDDIVQLVTLYPSMDTAAVLDRLAPIAEAMEAFDRVDEVRAILSRVLGRPLS